MRFTRLVSIAATTVLVGGCGATRTVTVTGTSTTSAAPSTATPAAVTSTTSTTTTEATTPPDRTVPLTGTSCPDGYSVSLNSPAQCVGSGPVPTTTASPPPAPATPPAAALPCPPGTYPQHTTRCLTDGGGMPICASGDSEDNGDSTTTCIANLTPTGDGLTPQENQQLAKANIVWPAIQACEQRNGYGSSIAGAEACAGAISP